MPHGKRVHKRGRFLLRRTWRNTKRFALVTVPEWRDECLIFAGLLVWTLGRVIPVEFAWSSTAIAYPRFA